MPDTPFIQLRIAGAQIDIPQTRELPVSISYEIEDEADFRQKKPGTALDITVPATTNNSSKLNTLFNPGSEDTLPDDGLDKPMNAVLVGSGDELMKGKAFVLRAREQFGKPLNFDINIFGDNADWAIPNKELTLHDVVTEVTHVFNKTNIEASWAFDGTDIDEDYVYAPVRYREPFGNLQGLTQDEADLVIRPENMRPAIFVYWLLYRGFQMAGYRLISNFMDTEYYRRGVLPWTWGEFYLVNPEALANLKFLATGPLSTTKTYTHFGDAFSWYFISLSGTGPASVNTTPRYNASPSNNTDNFLVDNTTTDIGYIGNPLAYSYNPANGDMEWTYLSAFGAVIGRVTAGFEFKLTASIDVSLGSNAHIWIEVYVNGVLRQSNTGWFAKTATFPTASAEDFGTRTALIEVADIDPGDIVTAKFRVSAFKSTLGYCFVKMWASGDDVRPNPQNASQTTKVRSYMKLAYLKRQLGSTINFKLYEVLKKWKWLDLLRGEVDLFNLQFNTDPIAKTVTIEPTHSYILQSTGPQPGYYNGKIVSWSEKRDLSKVSEIEVYQDYEKEVVMRMKDDPNDGVLKAVQDRAGIKLAALKYVFPDRFKKGSKDIENRFYGTVMHYDHLPFSYINAVTPQFIVLMPENINNTSNKSSESQFFPKRAWYKGVVDRGIYGAWNWDGDTSLDLPFMFAVNYKQDGQLDPVLTYCDQRISDGAGGFVKGFGLFRTFFLQRFAIMRHGKKYAAHFKLNNTDVVNQLHREFKTIDNQRYQLISINGYKPLLNESVMCRLWKWYPITVADNDSMYPSDDSVMDDALVSPTDSLYLPCMALPTDIRLID